MTRVGTIETRDDRYYYQPTERASDVNAGSKSTTCVSIPLIDYPQKHSVPSFFTECEKLPKRVRSSQKHFHNAHVNVLHVWRIRDKLSFCTVQHTCSCRPRQYYPICLPHRLVMHNLSLVQVPRTPSSTLESNYPIHLHCISPTARYCIQIVFAHRQSFVLE